MKKKTTKPIGMKPALQKKKTSKSDKDYISETISFVIKGKLTPIKPLSSTNTRQQLKKKEAETTKPQIVTRKCKMKSKPMPKSSKKIVKALKKPVIDQNKSTVKKVLKPEVKLKTKKVVKKVVENTKADVKPETISKAEDITTKKTIEKLLRQANRALKPRIHQKNKKSSKSVMKPEEATSSKVKEESVCCSKNALKRKHLNDTFDDTSASEDLPLHNFIKKEGESINSKKIKVKSEVTSDTEKKSNVKHNHLTKLKKSTKANSIIMKKRMLNAKNKVKRKENPVGKKLKLYSFWNGPKRHRVASLNALAKVHCLYENESRASLLDAACGIPLEKGLMEKKPSDTDDEVPCTRTLRSVPGLRAVGKHWDMHDTTSSSEETSGSESIESAEKPKVKVKKELKKNEPVVKKLEPKRRRNRSEILMDLKDMVVRKRMASLNASAILAASYSVEKRTSKSPKSDDTSEPDSSDYFHTDNDEDLNDKALESEDKKEEDSKLIEVKATPNKKVAVIVNQDTDVTITGVYVNSTTRSTHHEGYCSIAGMQYRISATSHTQTAATAVATETLMQSSSSSAQENVSVFNETDGF